MNILQGYQFLAHGGLNLAAVFDCATLPTEISAMMQDVPLDDYQRLVLLGHGGRRMWAVLQERGMAEIDPVDTYSTKLTREFIHTYLDSPKIDWLYHKVAKPQPKKFSRGYG